MAQTLGGYLGEALWGSDMYSEINEQGVLLVLQDLEEDERRRAPFAMKLIYSLVGTLMKKMQPQPNQERFYNARDSVSWRAHAKAELWRRSCLSGVEARIIFYLTKLHAPRCTIKTLSLKNYE